MMISRYFVEFIIFSFLGWVWETLFCSITNKRWEKRGFLIGPICPIYGVACISGFILMDSISVFQLPPLSWWQILLISFFGSAVLEYSTSFILEKLFHALWWDYSDMPLNLNGRVCLPASCGFAIAGLLLFYVIYPLFHYWGSVVPSVIFEVLALVMCALITIDLTLTLSALTDIQKKVSMFEEHINDNMTDFTENLYSNINSISKSVLSKIEKVRHKEPAQLKIYTKLMEKIKNKKGK